MASTHSSPSAHDRDHGFAFQISRRSHGIFDYVGGFLLVASAFVLPYPDGPMRMIGVALGAVLLLYSLGTDYEAGLLRFIPFPIHRGADLILGVMLVFSPIHFAVYGAPAVLFALIGAALLYLSFCTSSAGSSNTGLDKPILPGSGK